MTPQMQRAYDAYQYDLRLEKVVDMAVEAALTPELNRLSEVMEEDLVDHLVSCRIDMSMVPLAQYLLEQGEDNDEVLEQICDMIAQAPDLMGVCLQVATPVKEWSEDGSGCTFSWGYAQLNWVYGITYDEAWARAVEWAKGKSEPPVKED